MSAATPLQDSSADHVIRPIAYTTGALASLFAWLLWGDFTLTLMESAMPQLLPLTLNKIGASNATVGLMVGSIPALMNVVMNPIISTASDRHRSPRGRRIPFLLWPSPAIAVCMVLLGFCEPISGWLHATFFGTQTSFTVAQVTLGLAAVLVIAFQFFHLFVGALYVCLFADVVPHKYMGRFLGFFRIVSQFAGFVWGRYIFGWADTHMPWIYVGVALLYLVSFTAMCYGVKEGEYPPPPPLPTRRRPWEWLRDYVRECFSHPIYIGIPLITSLYMFSQATNVLWIFFCRDTCRLSLEEVGRINGWCAILGIPAVIIFGWMVDRIHALRVLSIGIVIAAAASIHGYFFVNDYNSLLVNSLIYTLGWIGFQTGQIPMYISLFPRLRYGQFSSANAMVSSLAIVISNWAVGAYIDHTGDYRDLLIWRAASWALVLLPLGVVLRHWRRHGGMLAYVAPAIPAKTVQAASV